MAEFNEFELTLRRDFAVECGFLAIMRAPLSAELYEQLCKAEVQDASIASLDEINIRRADYQIPRFVGYFYAATCATVTDGTNTVTIPYSGLFASLMQAVYSEAQRSRVVDDYLNPIVAMDDAEDPAPRCALIQDTRTGVCRLHRYKDTHRYLTFLNYLSS